MISLLYILIAIILLVMLIAVFDFNAFLSFLISSIFLGFLLGMEPLVIVKSLQQGMGDLLGSLIIVIVTGAMLGKLVANSGAAERIVNVMIGLCGKNNIAWALMITGFMIGIPLFYNVGFMLVVPIIFSVAYRYQLSALYVGLPMIASLSVTHGFLPPHPSPTALVAQFNASMTTTLFYGILISIPALIMAGPIFSSTLKNITSTSKVFTPTNTARTTLPSTLASIFTALLPVILLGVTALLPTIITTNAWATPIAFIGEPSMVMLISLLAATVILGIAQKTPLKVLMHDYNEAIKDVSVIILIMAGAGTLKQIILDGGVVSDIEAMVNMLDVNPLILGWLIAVIIRLFVGSATVAGLTAAGIIAPLLHSLSVDPNLMVIVIGAGSIFFSHVNDTGFWLFKEYFGLTIKQTIRSWSLMETIVSICGLLGALIIQAIIA
jgi:Gnt-I system high-affinity gluconate transporter